MVKSFLIIILGASFLIAPSAQAITKQTYKECLLCHVLWFDVFKTDQLTLIGQRDFSIVIAGSKGLASTKEICISCHDGYVVDSRGKIIKGNPHHSINKLPGRLKLPEIFRLDSRGEIYCGTCHTLHDIKGSGEEGGTPFMRMGNKRSQICIACHGDKTGPAGYPNHLIPQEANQFPRFEAAEKGSKFGPEQEIICESCHSAHLERAMTPLFQYYFTIHDTRR